MTKTRTRSFVIGSLVAMGALVACAGGGEDNGGSSCPEGTYDLDNDPQHDCEYKCTPGPKAPDDPMDGDFVDENCDGTDGVVGKLLFVATDGADAPNGGTREAPYKTIAYALSRAKDEQKDVAVSGESYTGEVDLVSGVGLYGSFNEHAPGFPFRRSKTTPTTLTAKGTVVVAAGIDQDTHLEGFVIEAATPDGMATGAGAGTYGVRLVGGLGTLYVRYNDITAEPGQDGAIGQDGSDGDPGVNGNDGTNGCSHCGNAGGNGGAGGGMSPMSTCGGAAGGAGGQGGWDQSAGLSGGNGSGANSQGGAGGAGNSTCSVSGGGDGQPGQSPTQAGDNGADGAAPAAKGMLAMDATYTPAMGASGMPGAAGNSGGGGGGGGGGTNGGLCYGDQGSGGGSGGTGGCGGTPGTAGGSGGASFGIAARAGKIVAGENKIKAGRGGNGGAGGKGGNGGTGGKGGAGKGRNDDGGASGPGGNGSAGGKGGNGAGGAGGPAACIATAQGVVLDETPVNTCNAFGGGTGGAGGNNAPNNGPDGDSKPTLTF